MVEVYYYIPAEEAENIVACGLKLSQWFEKEVCIEGQSRRCIATLLNPRDDPDKFRSPELKCIKLELASDYCYVADRALYQVGLSSPDVMEIYENSIMPAEKYIFGTYRMPECLVTCTVIADQIRALDKHLDSPILYSNSEELYVNNIIEGYKEEYRNFNDTMLYCFYSKLSDEGALTKVEGEDNGLAVFLRPDGEKVFAVRIPDMKAFDFSKEERG